MKSELFLDASYAIALTAPGDHHHRRAVELSEQIEAGRVRLTTTRAVLLEIGNSLARNRQIAVALLSALEGDPSVEIVALSDSLYQRAFALFAQRGDKTWGLTDCVSFLVMQERGLTDALTTDRHFGQAGFRALLRDEPVR
jgi:predicted nucleic acid-binding protein